jgi:uridine phosphorylase
MNNKIFEESELIINKKGQIYHLGAAPGEIAEKIILVGDPDRVKIVSSHFDKIELKISNREITTHTGTYKDKRISVISTGMGPDNIDIVINELDALFNIDFAKRTEKKKKTSLDIIRVGTSGSLQEEVEVGSFVVSTYGLGIDGLLNFYGIRNEVCDLDFEEEFIKHTSWHKSLGQPYVVSGSEKLLKKFDKTFTKGITITAAGFYAPQGRHLRLEPAFPKLIEKYRKFRYYGEKILNFEMETSALYGLGKALGHNTLTACLIVANRVSKEFCKDYNKKMDELIIKVLNNIIKR